MEVIQVPDRPAPRRFYAVSGRLLFVEAVDPQIRKLIVDLFTGWQLEPVSFPDRPPDIRIECFCGDSPLQIPPNLNRFEIAEGGQCYTDRGDFYLELGDALVHLENDAPVRVRVWFDKLPSERDPLPARAMSIAVCSALRRFGMFELHSAGMIEPRSEKGVLIVGRSGSGKSTLAFQLAMAGWPYLSDDEVLLSLVDGEIEARGFRSFFAVRGASALKTCFEPDDVFASGRWSKASPGVLLFTTVSGQQKTRVNQLTQAEAMTRLIRACPWATYDTSIAGANLELLSKLARHTSAYDLSAGGDLLEPGYAASLLSVFLFTSG